MRGGSSPSERMSEDAHPKVIEAAGGILWRRAAGVAELAVIHRPRHQDWSLPKGKRDPGESWQETALRETHEEVGIEPSLVEVIGYLQAMPTITGFAVTPVVGIIGDEPDLVIDRTEVDYTFELPLDFLLDEGNDRLVDREWHGKAFRLKEFHYAGERVWGATAYMLLAFRKFILNK